MSLLNEDSIWSLFLSLDPTKETLEIILFLTISASLSNAKDETIGIYLIKVGTFIAAMRFDDKFWSAL